MNRCVLYLLAMTLAVAVHSPARAVVLFADDFENTTGPLPALPDMPQAGEWYRFPASTPESHVIDSAVPGAHSGSNYLWIDRPTRGEFGNAGISDGATIPGTVVHAEWWMNVTEGYAGFGFNTTPGNNVQTLRPFLYAVPDAANTIGYYVPASVNPNEYLPTGLNYLNDVWQKYELDTTIGSSSVTLTVDGISAPIPGPFGISPTSTIDAVYGMLFVSASSTVSFYVDDVLVEAIPEPSSLTILGIALLPLGQIARKWKNKK